jgi:hypothetical protein
VKRYQYRIEINGDVVILNPNGVNTAQYSFTDYKLALLIAATIGVISPSGNEVGPFLSIEQATLSHIVEDRARTRAFAWYTLTGAVATALGSLCAGLVIQSENSAVVSIDKGRQVVLLYAGLGLALTFLFSRLSPSAEVKEVADAIPVSRDILGISHSRPAIFRLAGLFALDAFGGGFVVQSFVAYWFHLRFATEPAVLGSFSVPTCSQGFRLSSHRAWREELGWSERWCSPICLLTFCCSAFH